MKDVIEDLLLVQFIDGSGLEHFCWLPPALLFLKSFRDILPQKSFRFVQCGAAGPEYHLAFISKCEISNLESWPFFSMKKGQAAPLRAKITKSVEMTLFSA